MPLNVRCGVQFTGSSLKLSNFLGPRLDGDPRIICTTRRSLFESWVEDAVAWCASPTPTHFQQHRTEACSCSPHPPSSCGQILMGASPSPFPGTFGSIMSTGPCRFRLPAKSMYRQLGLMWHAIAARRAICVHGIRVEAWRVDDARASAYAQHIARSRSCGCLIHD